MTPHPWSVDSARHRGNINTKWVFVGFYNHAKSKALKVKNITDRLVMNACRTRGIRLSYRSHSVDMKGCLFVVISQTACVNKNDTARRKPYLWAHHGLANIWLLGLLTHWGRDKMDAISQTTLSNAFSWMKMLEFRLTFHWSLFLRV